MRWGVVCLCVLAFCWSRGAEPKLINAAEVNSTQVEHHTVVNDVVDAPSTSAAMPRKDTIVSAKSTKVR